MCHPLQEHLFRTILRFHRLLLRQFLLPLLNQGSGALNKQVGALGKSTGMTKESMTASMNLAKQQRQLSAATLGF